MTYFALVKKGYGTLAEIKSWDTPQFLDVVEYEQICSDIEQYQLQNPESK